MRMEVIKSLANERAVVRVYLSERNVKTLLSKAERIRAGREAGAERDASAGTLVTDFDCPEGVGLAVTVELDEDHYRDRPPAGEVLPEDDPDREEETTVLGSQSYDHGRVGP